MGELVTADEARRLRDALPTQYRAALQARLALTVEVQAWRIAELEQALADAERDELWNEVMALGSEKADLFTQLRSADADRAALEAVARRLLDGWRLNEAEAWENDVYHPATMNPTPEEQRVLDLLREAQ